MLVMRYILPLLFCISCLAQPSPINRRAMAIAGLAKTPTGWTDPSGANKLKHWWVASDLTNAAVSVWTNRMVLNSNLITNGTAAVTFTVNHVVISGIFKSLVTSPSQSFDGRYSPTTNGGCIAVIFTQNQSTTTGEILSSTNGQNILDVLSDGASLRAQVSAIGPIAKNTILDCLINADGYVYTNSVLGQNRSGQIPALGFDGVGRLKGNVYEILIWTNGPLSSVNISNFHYYATNTYGFTP